jgi:endoglucanase
VTRASIGRNLIRALVVAVTLGLPSSLAVASGTTVLRFVGVNLSGAEFKQTRLPGTVFKDYTYPIPADFDYFAAQGMNVIRLPFLWERLQPALSGDLDPQQLLLLKKTVEMAKYRHMSIVLDVHNYGRYRGKDIGSADVPTAAFADFWTRLSKIFANDPAVIFGLMNEPAQIPATQWAVSAKAALAAIRATGAKNLVLVPGTYYSGGHSWMAAVRGSSNADAFANFTDPGHNIAFEVHQYFDKDYSGTTTTCVGASVGPTTLQQVTTWLRRERQRGFLGEFGASTDPTCMEALRETLAYLQQNSDVWLGWTYWSAGDWWGDYPFNVTPAKGGPEKPQLTILSEFARQVTGAK